MMLWLELGGACVALAIVWACIETYFLGSTGPRKYVDAAIDHPPGEEGLSPYQRATGWPASTTRAILDQMAADSAKERTAQKRAAQDGTARSLDEALLNKVRRTIARPAHIARKRDGMSLSAEASAEVYRSVFGDDPPAC